MGNGTGSRKGPLMYTGMMLLQELNQQQEHEPRPPKFGAKIISIWSRRRRNKFKPELGKERGMVDESSIFPAVKTTKGSGWATVMFWEDDYGKAVTRKDKEGIATAKKQVLASDLSDKEKRRLMEYLKTAEDGDKLALNLAESMASEYLLGNISEERMDFELTLMQSWISGRIGDFLQDQLASIARSGIPEDEKKMLNEMIELALTRSQIVKGIAAWNLNIYYPKQKPEKRQEAISEMAYILRSAKPAIEQAQ